MTVVVVSPAPVDAGVVVTVEGLNLSAQMDQVFADASDTLLESKGFVSKAPQSTISTRGININWNVHWSVFLGIRKPAAGNWEIFIFPIYGSPLDTQSPSGKNRPYYSRTPLTATVGGTPITLETAGPGIVVGNGHGIPPTVVVYDPVTQAVVSSVEGHTLAFSQTTRIQEVPNQTGFADNGEFTLRYDHTIDDEGREMFYAMASWPCKWVDGASGAFVRGDKPGKGQPQNGFCCGEEGPYARIENLGSPVYPIEHIDVKTRYVDDVQAWDVGFEQVPRETRGTSGIGPFCLNIESRGSSILRDFGYAWLLKAQTACQLQLWPNPDNPHTTNQFMYNYHSSAMRGKGRILEALALLIRALGKLAAVRDITVDTEVTSLRLDSITLFVNILKMLKQDYVNDSWLEYTRGNSGRAISGWMLGHYLQSLILVQESILELGLPLDPDVQDMSETFAEWIHDHTYLWVHNGPHPLDSSVTYTGGKNGYFMAYYDEVNVPSLSAPTTGISPSLIICYEWAKVHGIRQGAKQDAIIAQFSTVNYKWKLGTDIPRRLLGELSLAGAGTLTIDEPATTRGGEVTFAGEGSFSAAGTVTGGGSAVRTGTPIAVTSRSVGDAIALGPGINAPKTKTFSVVRLDDFRQPFTVTLDQSRSLTGEESWRGSVRRSADSSLLMTFDSADGSGSIVVDGGTFQPSFVFTPDGYALVAASEDEEYLYDLEMSHDGNSRVETYSIDEVSIRTIERRPGAAAFTVVRGDDFIQPFLVTLDDSRTLDGSETWSAELRASATGSALMSFSVGAGTIDVDPVTFQPSMVFLRNNYGNIPIGKDTNYFYSLRMSKGGKVETSALDVTTIRTDLSR